MDWTILPYHTDAPIFAEKSRGPRLPPLPLLCAFYRFASPFFNTLYSSCSGQRNLEEAYLFFMGEGV